MNNKFILGPLEQDIMKCLWKKNKGTVRDVHTCLKNNRPMAYTTVMTIMTRLVSKGYLSRKLEGKTYVYKVETSKNKTLKKTLAKMTEYILKSFGEEAIASFIKELDEDLSDEKKKEMILRLKNETSNSE